MSEKCSLCKFFEASEDKQPVLEEAAQSLSDLVDREDLERIKAKWQTVIQKTVICDYCMLVWCYKSAISHMRATIQEEQFTKLLTLLKNASDKRFHMEVTETYLAEERNIPSDSRKYFYHVFVKLAWLGEQPPQVNEKELNFIQDLRKQGFSMGDLAFIFDRSKSTIHECLQERDVTL